MPKKYNKSPVKLVKRGNIYHITISTIIAGQRVFIRESSHSTDRNQALQYANQRLQDIIKQAEFQTSQLKEVTIDYAFGLFWEEVGKLHANAKDTLNKLKNLTLYFNTQQYISNLTVEDITAFIRAKDAENRKNATINRYLALLSAVFTRCKLHKINLPDINIRQFMRKEPAENVKYFADWETVNKIIDNAAPHIKPIILTAIYTGFRISAILKLKWTDIIGDEFIINVKDSKFEGGKIQRKPIFPVMKDLLDTLPHDSDYIFTYKGLPIKRINKGWNRAWNVPDCRIRQFTPCAILTQLGCIIQPGICDLLRIHSGIQILKRRLNMHTRFPTVSSRLWTAFCTKSTQTIKTPS